ncbi:MAG: STAS domain-containing protein [Actinomycetota bacterium]
MAETDDMDLTLEDQTLGSWSILSVAGELDMHTSPALQERLEALSVGDSPRVAVDLSAVPFMDSSSLGMLVANLKRLQERGGELALVGVTGSPQKVLSITGIDRVIPAYGAASELPQD